MLKYIMNEKNRWIIIFLFAVCLLIFLNIDSSENYEHASGTKRRRKGKRGKRGRKGKRAARREEETITDTSTDTTTIVPGAPDRNSSVRVPDDFYTIYQADEPDTKILYLKCKIPGQGIYYLAFLDTALLGDCTACSVGNVKDKMPVLINESYTVDEDCYETEFTNCFNAQERRNCEKYVNEEICDNSKINMKHCEMIIEKYKKEKVESRDEKETDIVNGKKKMEIYHLLKPNVEKENIMLSAIEEKVEEKENLDPLNIVIPKKKHLICFDEVTEVIGKQQKLYSNTKNLEDNKVKFRFSFKFGKTEKFLAACHDNDGKDICDPTLCKKDSKDKNICKENFKYLCLSNKVKDALIFEPEFVKLQSATA
jgi:hypothetical protein